MWRLACSGPARVEAGDLLGGSWNKPEGKTGILREPMKCKIQLTLWRKFTTIDVGVADFEAIPRGQPLFKLLTPSYDDNKQGSECSSMSHEPLDSMVY